MSKTDKLKATALAAARKVAEKVKGNGAIYAELKKDHTMVSELMNSVIEAEDVDTCRELYPEIRVSLLAHALAEQRQFYSPLRSYDTTRSLVETHMQDHDEIEELIAKVDRLDFLDPRWMATFRQLRQVVEQHVELEENELFPRAQQVLSKDQAKEAATRFKTEEQEIKHRLETGQPTQARPYP